MVKWGISILITAKNAALKVKTGWEWVLPTINLTIPLKIWDQMIMDLPIEDILTEIIIQEDQTIDIQILGIPIIKVQTTKIMTRDMANMILTWDHRELMTVLKIGMLVIIIIVLMIDHNIVPTKLHHIFLQILTKALEFLNPMIIKDIHQIREEMIEVTLINVSQQ